MTKTFDDVRRANRRIGHALTTAVALVVCLAALVFSMTTAMPTYQCAIVAVAGVLLAACLWRILPALLDRQTGTWS